MLWLRWSKIIPPTFSEIECFQSIGEELVRLEKGSVEACQSFIRKHSQNLHPNHYYLQVYEEQIEEWVPKYLANFRTLSSRFARWSDSPRQGKATRYSILPKRNCFTSKKSGWNCWRLRTKSHQVCSCKFRSTYKVFMCQESRASEV